jgi:hypothetical protein
MAARELIDDLAIGAASRDRFDSAERNSLARRARSGLGVKAAPASRVARASLGPCARLRPPARDV